MTTPVQTAILVGLGLGTVHYLAHRLGGEEMSFEEAGVNTAGIAVTLGGMVATYIVLTLAGVAG
jgi:hypothetical protein